MKKSKTNLDTYNRGRLEGFHAKRDIWAYVSANPGAPLKQIAAAVGLSGTATHYHLSALLATGVLVADRAPSGKRLSRTLRAPLPLIVVRKGS